MCGVSGSKADNARSFSQHSFYQIQPHPAPLLCVQCVVKE